MDLKNLKFEKEDGIGIVTINRPDVLNALNVDVFAEIGELFQAIENDSDVRVVILTGSGEKAFIAGADISYMKDKNGAEIGEFVVIARKGVDSIRTLSKPVIAAVNGYALGGGWEVAMSCDLIIASSNARFGLPEITLGVVPGGGGMQRLVRVAGVYRAKELVYTGDVIDVDAALAMGMVNKVVALENLMDEAKALAKKLMNRGGIALAYAKEAMNNGPDMDLASGMDADQSYFARCFDTEDQKEGMAAFVEKRKPVFKNR